jgi:hypothetical protein
LKNPILAINFVQMALAENRSWPILSNGKLLEIDADESYTQSMSAMGPVSIMPDRIAIAFQPVSPEHA